MEEPIYILDHLIIMGIDVAKPITDYNVFLSGELPIEFLDIYPLKNPNNIPTYLTRYSAFCFPEGIKSLPEEELENISKYEQIFHFVITDEKNIKRFCTTLIIYEKFYIPNSQTTVQISKPMPKVSLNRLISNPLSLTNSATLILVPKSVSLISRLPIFDLQKSLLNFFYSIFVENNRKNNKIPLKIPLNLIQNFDKLILSNGLFKGEKIFMQEFKNYWDNSGKILKICKQKIREFYISVMFSLLRLSEGDIEIAFIGLRERNMELFRLRINTEIGINLPNFSLKPLFSKLTLDNILRVVKYLLLEKKLLFITDKPGEIATITESLLSLIAPMTWGCIYIPLLLDELYEYVEATQPFVIGLSKNLFYFIKERFYLGDKVIIDLDENTITYEEENERVLMPSVMKEYILEKMSSVLQLHKEFKRPQRWEETALRTKQFFWNNMLLLLKNFQNYFLPISREKNKDNLSFYEIFNTNAYISSFDPSERAFMQEFCQTMIFSKFVEDCLQFLNECALPYEPLEEVSLFISDLRLYREKDNLISVEKLQEEKIKRILSRNANPEKQEIMPYFIKYLRYLELLKKVNKTIVKNPKCQKKQNYFLKWNKEVELFPKLNRAKIINLDNLATQVMLLCLENKIYNNIGSSIFPTNEDFDFFHGNYLEGSDSIPNNRNSAQPKVITLISNLETSIVFKKSESPEKENNDIVLPLEMSLVTNYEGSPRTNTGANFMKEIMNYYVYYHAVRRNQRYHKRAYSKSIHISTNVESTTKKQKKFSEENLEKILENEEEIKNEPNSLFFKKRSRAKTINKLGSQFAQFSPIHFRERSFNPKRTLISSDDICCESPNEENYSPKSFNVNLNAGLNDYPELKLIEKLEDEILSYNDGDETKKSDIKKVSFSQAFEFRKLIGKVELKKRREKLVSQDDILKNINKEEIKTLIKKRTVSLERDLEDDLSKL